MQSVIVLGLAALGAAQQSFPTVPVVTNNVAGTTYTATLGGQGVSDPAGITGFVTVAAPANGTGALVTVNLNNIPAQSAGGPFPYHIHAAPVSGNGSCVTTLAHLDPSGRGEDPVCDASQPATCQAGDLAGKHGKITSSPSWQQTYSDPYLSTTPGTPAFIGNRSITIHFANKTRIACANFVLGSSPSAGTASPTGGVPVPPQGSSTSAPITPANGATSMGWSVGAVLMAGLAFAL